MGVVCAAAARTLKTKPQTELFSRIRSEPGPAGVALLHEPPRGAAGRAAGGAGHPGRLPLPHAVGRVRQGLAAPQQLHGLRPQGEYIYFFPIIPKCLTDLCYNLNPAV